MNNSMVFSYAARLRKMGNDYILSELGNAGLVDIVPSHGEILLYLLQAGTLRILAVSSAEPIEGVEAPTLKEAGLDVVLQNWRMVSAAPGISADQKAAITADIEKMAKSPSVLRRGSTP